MRHQAEKRGILTGSHDDELANTSVESLCGFVGSFFELLVVRGLWEIDFMGSVKY